ncbi:MAG: hypothetical protein J3K34DRAFT_458093 [Monoraphidium minutum]|nr:MAG: hypothetical protein J3K34DRAFT_458093 [Monoraphidium minutum]
MRIGIHGTGVPRSALRSAAHGAPRLVGTPPSRARERRGPPPAAAAASPLGESARGAPSAPSAAPPARRRAGRAARGACRGAALDHAAVTAAWRAASARERGLPDHTPAELVAVLSALADAADAGGADGEEFLSDLLLSSTWLLSLRAAAATQLELFGAARLAALARALGRLPLQAEVSPLPIGFGTPRWALPRAVADTGKWEAFLCAMADVFIEDVAHMLEANQSSGGHASAASAPPPPAQAQAQAALTSFACGLAASNKWSTARVDAAWVGSRECEARVAEFVARRWPRLLEQLRAADAACGEEAGAGEGGGGTAARRARLRRRAVLDFLVRAQLQHRMAPPAPLLARFFDAAPPPAPPAAAGGGAGGGGCDEPYSLDDLESIVRTLLQIGRSPSEPWLRGLVGVAAARHAEMGQQQLRGFVEGLRFFRTQHGGCRQLRDGISLLSEWI